MNKVILMGRLTRDPESRTTANNNLQVSFPLAVDRPFKREGGQEADFFYITAYSVTAEFIYKYFHRGMKILIEGHLRSSSYEKNGERRYTTDVVADRVEFGESKRADAQAGGDVPPSITENLPFR